MAHLTHTFFLLNLDSTQQKLNLRLERLFGAHPQLTTEPGQTLEVLPEHPPSRLFHRADSVK